MAVERTLSIIKPDAVAKNVIGKIYSRFEKAGLKIVASKMIHMDDEKAGGFYAEHKERPFYGDLVSFMTSGPVVVQVLEGENAVLAHRDLMGATNPKEQQKVQSVQTSQSLSMRTQYTVLIQLNQQLVKYLTSSQMQRFAHAAKATLA